MVGIQNVIKTVTPVAKIAGAFKQSSRIIVSPKAKQAVDAFVSSKGKIGEYTLESAVGKIKGVIRRTSLETPFGKINKVKGLSLKGEAIQKLCFIGKEGQRVMQSGSPNGTVDLIYKNCSEAYAKDASLGILHYFG